MIKDLFRAFRAGQQLANSTTWKNAQLRTSLLVVVISTAIGVAALLGYHVPLSSEEILAVATVIGVVGGMLNGGVTVATTTRIGLPDKTDDQPGERSPGVAVIQPASKPDDADVFGSGPLA